MKQKIDISKGDVLSLDPGTNLCGVALWRNGRLVASRVLKSYNTLDNVSDRLRAIADQLNDFLNLYEAHVTCIITENPPDTLLRAAIGIILISPRVHTYFSDRFTLGVMEWKKWAANNGATGPFKDIKGVRALGETGFAPLPETDDEADAIMVYLAYRDKYGNSKAMRRRDRPSSPSTDRRF